MHSYDVIIVGAGSIGVPTAMTLAKLGIKTLVIDSNPSPGQGENKKAIGGIRATHSDPTKIIIGQRSLEIFSTWKETYGDNIEWMTGGYLFPVYLAKQKSVFKKLLPVQQKLGLKIDFIKTYEVKKLIPEINGENLIGGIFSPNDGSASPLLSIHSFTKHAIANGAVFRFKETVHELTVSKNKILGVRTNKQEYKAPIVIDAAGPYSSKLCEKLGLNIQVIPELHEAAVTEPIQRLFKCMIVDLRTEEGSKNFYLYQNFHGQIIFCITPNPPILGTNNSETSFFLPEGCKRVLNLIPSLQNTRVRRMWRGCYPMTPDGSPIIGWNKDISGLLHLTGMCGQGFMLGPGIAELASKIVTQACDEFETNAQEVFSPYRQFYKKQETLK